MQLFSSRFLTAKVRILLLASITLVSAESDFLLHANQACRPTCISTRYSDCSAVPHQTAWSEHYVDRSMSFYNAAPTDSGLKTIGNAAELYAAITTTESLLFTVPSPKPYPFQPASVTFRFTTMDGFKSTGYYFYMAVGTKKACRMPAGFYKRVRKIEYSLSR
jgi:hypothetical protein